MVFGEGPVLSWSSFLRREPRTSYRFAQASCPIGRPCTQWLLWMEAFFSSRYYFAGIWSDSTLPAFVIKTPSAVATGDNALWISSYLHAMIVSFIRNWTFILRTNKWVSSLWTRVTYWLDLEQETIWPWVELNESWLARESILTSLDRPRMILRIFELTLKKYMPVPRNTRCRAK